MTDSILDLDHLDRQTFGDPELRREIVTMFRQQAAEIVGAIEAAAGGTAATDLAHRLKGSAVAVGAFRLGGIAALIERGELDAASPRLRAALAEVIDAMANI
jgi:HPt (histidine-containing phosphotransfer) domain-containing protein